MRLAIFDIDGTLTRTGGLYDDLFCEVMAEELGVDGFDRNWGSYVHATDSAIVHELFVTHRGRTHHEEELARVRERYFAGLKKIAERGLAVAGAADALERLPREGWTVAFATGNWGPSARLKLDRAGLPHENRTLASADDGSTRAEILQVAIDRAGRGLRRSVYLGDASWDVTTTREIGLPLVGIGPNPALHAASHRLADYTDFNALLAALEGAAVAS